MTGAVRAPVANPGGPASAEDARVTWTYDPWRERPRVATLGLVAAALMCALILSLRENPVLTIGLCFACLASFSPALAPVECRLEASGPARRGLFGWERRPWSAIRRIEPLPAGARLSPYAEPHWLDATRGMVLPMPADRRLDLIEVVRQELARHGA